jgi:hypothetical protein
VLTLIFFDMITNNAVHTIRMTYFFCVCNYISVSEHQTRNFMKSSTKTLIHVPAEYVDAANDAVKWAVALTISTLFNTRGLSAMGLGMANGSLFGVGTHRQAMVSAIVLAIGFLVYQILVSRFVMFVPMPGQATYYIALKRS